MPSLETLPSGRTRWVVSRNGLRYSSSLNSRTAARTFALNLEDLIDTDHIVDHPSGKHPAEHPPPGVKACCRPPDPPRAMTMTFGTWRETWWGATAPTRQASTRAKNVSYIRHHIAPHWDDRLLGPDGESGIVKSGVQRWVNSLPKAAATVAAIHALFVEILTAAVNDRILDANPARGITLPADDADEVTALDNLGQVFDLAALFERRDDGLLLLTGAGSGNRTSELFGLQVEDWDGSALHIRAPTRTICRGPLVEVAGQFHHKEPKSEAGKRVILMGKPWRPLLDDLADRRRNGKPCPLCGRPHLFVAPQGGPYRRSNFTRRLWAPRAEKIRAGLTFKGATRHTHESLMEQWVPESARRRRLGHAVEGMSGVYGHDTPDMQQLIVSGWEQRWMEAVSTRPGWWSG